MSDAAAAKRCEDRFFTVDDGLRLHYHDYPGDAGKPPLLCLPGLTRNARDFEDFAERYSPRFRVLAIDFRGRGASDYDPVPDRYIPPTYAQDVIDLLDQLAIPGAIFVGTSLGGLVTMLMAIMAPQRITAATIRSGAVIAMAMVTSPPSDVPMKMASAIPSWSSISTTSAA